MKPPMAGQPIGKPATETKDRFSAVKHLFHLVTNTEHRHMIGAVRNDQQVIMTEIRLKMAARDDAVKNNFRLVGVGAA